MKMTQEDYKIYSVSSTGRMVVVADMAAITKEWPEIIFDEKTGKNFKFITQEPMEIWMLGKFAGHARYEEIVQS